MKAFPWILAAGAVYFSAALAAGPQTPTRADLCAARDELIEQLRSKITELRLEVSSLRSRLNGAPDTDAEPETSAGEPRCLADGYVLKYIIRRQNVCGTQQLPISDTGYETETVPSNCETKNVQVPVCRYMPAQIQP